MEANEFLPKCKQLVLAHTLQNQDVENNMHVSINDVYVVWSCKTLQNYKALLSTNVADGMYYELTLNGDKNEIYFDAYEKVENKVIDCSPKEGE